MMSSSRSSRFWGRGWGRSRQRGRQRRQRPGSDRQDSGRGTLRQRQDRQESQEEDSQLSRRCKKVCKDIERIICFDVTGDF